MLLLVTIALVLVGAVSLVIGFVSNSLVPIYISIGCSVVAGIVLVVFSRMSRRQAAAPTGAPTAAGASTWAPSPQTAGRASEAEPEPEPTPAPQPEVAAAPAEQERTLVGGRWRRPGPAEPEPALTEEEDDEDFPIEDYDDLRANEILPVLPELDLDELDMVREREERGKNRATIINRIDDLIDELEAEEAEADVEPAGVASARGPVDDEVGVAGPPADVGARLGDAGPAVEDEDFPFPDYDEMTVEEILSQLDDLDDEELDMVAEREEQGQNRAEILDRIDAMFEEVEVLEDEEAPPPAERAPAEEAAPARAGVEKMTGKKAPAAKAAKATKKMTGKKAAKAAKAAKKMTGKKAAKAAKKAPAGAPGKKTAVKKVTGKKAPGPVKSADEAPAKKAPAKKMTGKKAPQ